MQSVTLLPVAWCIPDWQVLLVAASALGQAWGYHIKYGWWRHEAGFRPPKRSYPS